jgi:hypothetical protein
MEKAGTYSPITTRTTVRGVESTSPTGPHRKVQATAAMMIPMADRPRLAPYNHGSMTLLLTSSRQRMKPPTQSGCCQSAAVIKLKVSGNSAPTMGPA